MFSIFDAGKQYHTFAQLVESDPFGFMLKSMPHADRCKRLEELFLQNTEFTDKESDTRLMHLAKLLIHSAGEKHVLEFLIPSGGEADGEHCIRLTRSETQNATIHQAVRLALNARARQAVKLYVDIRQHSRLYIVRQTQELLLTEMARQWRDAEDESGAGVFFAFMTSEENLPSRDDIGVLEKVLREGTKERCKSARLLSSLTDLPLPNPCGILEYAYAMVQRILVNAWIKWSDPLQAALAVRAAERLSGASLSVGVAVYNLMPMLVARATAAEKLREQFQRHYTTSPSRGTIVGVFSYELRDDGGINVTVTQSTDLWGGDERFHNQFEIAKSHVRVWQNDHPYRVHFLLEGHVTGEVVPRKKAADLSLG
jgi:hypothetical protein